MANHGFRQTGKKWILITAILLIGLLPENGFADDLDDLMDLSQAPAATDTGANVEKSAGSSGAAGVSGLSVNIGGYLKTLGYWSQERYSDTFWQEMYLNLPARPADQELSGYTNVGTRLQVKLEGYLGDRARLFTAVNIDYNTAHSLHSYTLHTDEDRPDDVDLRMIEGFAEIFEHSRVWKVGMQLVTWSYLEGLEVPTDRVNAWDRSYKSTEYEDSKIASTGLLVTQRMGSVYLEAMAIPVAESNVNPAFYDYLYTGKEEEISQCKPDDGKWAARLFGTIGYLDWAVSYVDGPDPVADIYVYSEEGTGAMLVGKTYNRIRSPGLDLQYNLFDVALAKLSAVYTFTEDEDGDDPMIKNSWGKYVVGAEFTVSGSTINLYAGQNFITDFKQGAPYNETNFLLQQIWERTDFISGHANIDFLTGNALNLVLMGANYWDQDGQPVQTVARATLKFKIADGLEILFGPTYSEILNNYFTDVQAEVKYSF